MPCQTQHTGILEHGHRGVAWLVSQQCLFAEAGTDAQLGHHLPFAAQADHDLHAASLDEVAAITGLPLAEQYMTGSQLDRLELSQHVPDIFRRHLGEQRVLQQFFQPVGQLVVAGQCQQQIGMGLMPRQQAIQLGAVDHQHAGVFQSPNLGQAATGCERMATLR